MTTESKCNHSFEDFSIEEYEGMACWCCNKCGKAIEDYVEQLESANQKLRECVEKSKYLVTKFINKVETGQAKSIETYKDCKDVLLLINSSME